MSELLHDDDPAIDEHCECLRPMLLRLMDENHRLREALEAIRGIDIPLSHDMQKVKYTDDYEVGTCEAVNIAQQALSEGRAKLEKEAGK